MNSLEEVKVFLRKKEILAISRALLQRVYLSSAFRHRTLRRGQAPESVNVRVFLAGYMIAYSTTHVFEDMGKLERSLLDAAVPMIESFQAIADAARRHACFSQVPAELTQNFPLLFFEYLQRFKVWKVADDVKLKGRIKHALNALKRVYDDSTEPKLREECRTQIEHLNAKLLRISGTNSGISSSNEQLKHELLLNPSFQLEEEKVEVSNRFYQAFWDSLEDDLKLPCYSRALNLLTDIREALNCKEIDIDFIRQQAEDGLYNWQNCIHLVTAIYAEAGGEKEEGWAQIQETMEKAAAEEQPRALCQALRFLLERVNVMRIKAANTKLRSIAGVVVQDHGVEYERCKFNEKLKDGSLTLVRTKEWITNTVRSEGTTTFLRVHTVGMLALVTQQQQQECPETLLLDKQRLCQLHTEFNYLSIASAMLVILGGNNHQAVAEIVVKGSDWAAIDGEDCRRILVQCSKPEDAVRKLMYSLSLSFSLSLSLSKPHTVHCLD